VEDLAVNSSLLGAQAGSNLSESKVTIGFTWT
jgi:hypothetical protein